MFERIFPVYSRLFKQFLYRDLVVYSHDYQRYFINYGLIYASLFSLSFGLIIPTIGMRSANPLLCTSIICGQILWVLFPISYHASTRILLDLQHQRFLDSQLLIAPALLLWLEKITFHALVIFVNVLPFFITTKLILGPSLLLSWQQFPSLLAILAISSLFFAIFSMAAISYIRSTLYTTIFFVRFVYPLISLSGLFISWYQIYAAYPRFAWCIRLNPFLYVTEAMRNVLLPSGSFIPLKECLLALFCYSVILLFVMSYFFRKKLDYV